MKTKSWAIGLVMFTTLLTSAAQIFFKYAANNLSFSLEGTLLNTPLWIGVCCYGLGAIFMIISFRGGEVTVLYPIFATSYVWVIMLSSVLFGETITLVKVLAIIVIIGGISLISFGGSKDSAIYLEDPV